MIHSRDLILKKNDPRKKEAEESSNNIINLIYASYRGDLEAIKRYIIKGVDINQGDYDGRTALHLAAAEGHENCVSFLITNGANARAKDRWGATPLDDAKKAGNDNILSELKKSNNNVLSYFKAKCWVTNQHFVLFFIHKQSVRC